MLTPTPAACHVLPQPILQPWVEQGLTTETYQSAKQEGDSTILLCLSDALTTEWSLYMLHIKTKLQVTI